MPEVDFYLCDVKERDAIHKHREGRLKGFFPIGLY